MTEKKLRTTRKQQSENRSDFDKSMSYLTGSLRKLEIFWETYPHHVSITEQIIKLWKQEGGFSLLPTVFVSLSPIKFPVLYILLSPFIPRIRNSILNCCLLHVQWYKSYAITTNQKTNLPWKSDFIFFNELTSTHYGKNNLFLKKE